MSDNDDRPGSVAEHPSDRPDPRGYALHRRLLERDPLAVQELWDYFDPLARHARNRIYDLAEREDVAHDLAMRVIVAMIERPERFDPTRGKGLRGYLLMDLTGDINNYLKKLERNPKPASLNAPISSNEGDVGQEDLLGNLPVDEPGPATLLLDAESRQRVAAIRQAAVVTTAEGIVFDLQYVDGERRTEIFAAALGISELPPREQAQEVQKLKDRLAKRLRRMERDIDERGRDQQRDSTG